MLYLYYFERKRDQSHSLSITEIFLAFLESRLNLEYFERKDQPHSLSITEIINCETRSNLNVQKAIFHTMVPKTTC